MTVTAAKPPKKNSSVEIVEAVVKKPRAKKLVTDVSEKPARKVAIKKTIASSVDEVVKVAKPRRVATKKVVVTPEERYKMVAAAAYFHAEKRGFQPGNTVADWAAAEAEIDLMLKNK
jgi:Protein of unknown function (DUF2934)